MGSFVDRQLFDEGDPEPTVCLLDRRWRARMAASGVGLDGELAFE